MNLSNRERAELAGELLDMMPDAKENGARENLVDLLSDLRHYCDYALIDFDAAVRMSEIHWREERTTDE